MPNKMELILDANVVMSALIATEGKTYDLIFNERIRLFTPEFLFEEIEKHKDEILSKSGLSNSDFELFLSLIKLEIEVIAKSEFVKLVPKAEKITPDPDDTEYFALALKLGCGIWSNDRRLKNQDKIKVYFTTDLLKIF